ncbi:MAG: hypothetical protein JOZ52_09920 [Acidobacteria bacterium]|nr:hypothetical protein [Acidobacteriota bacterium]
MICAARVAAHEGPPFPLFVDESASPYLVSVWADPDVGTGTFYIVPAVPQGRELPPELQVEVCVRPLSGRHDEACYVAARDAVRDRAQYTVGVPFDAEEVWHVRILLRSSLGNGERAADVNATPAGLGRWDLLLYLFPFAAVGSLWLLAVRKQRGALTNGLD